MIFLGWMAFLALVVVAVLVTWSRSLAALFPEKIRTAEVAFITTADGWRLRLCRYRMENTHGEPVLLVHGLNANQNNFSSPAGACLVDYLAARGFDCWTVDLRGTRSSRAPFGQGRNSVTVEDFVWRDLPAVLEHLRKATGHDKVHYVGHSLGGLLLFAYVQVHGAGQIASGTALGAPTTFSAVKPVIPAFLVHLVLRFPWLAGEGLRCVLPLVKLTGKAVSVFPINLSNLPYGMGLADFYPIIEDPAPLVHAQVFGWAERGEVTLRQDSLNLTRGYAAMKFPLLAVLAPLDPFVPLETGKAFFDSIQHGDKKLVVCSRENGCGGDYSHCDLAFGREGARDVFEPILQWMKAHPCDEAVKSAPAPAPAPKKAPEAVVVAKAPETAPEAAAVKADAAPRKAAVKKPAAAKEKADTAPAKVAVVKKVATTKKPAAAKEAPAAKPAAAVKKTAVPAKEKAPAAKAKPAPRKPAAKGRDAKG